MSKISDNDYRILKEHVARAELRKPEYTRVKKTLPIPDPNSGSLESARTATECLRQLFFDYKFNLMDVVVGEGSPGPVNQDDTHFKGRQLERVLNGDFNGLSQPDFKYAELKLIQTRAPHVLDQVMTVGCIFNSIDKSAGLYDVVDDYALSPFYKKMRRAIIVSYRRESKAAGVTPDGVFLFTADNPLWSQQLQEDWISIRDEMKTAIKQYVKGTRPRRASGICSSDTRGLRRPHGYLGIRSDGVIFTKQFFELISTHYNK